VAGAVLVGVSVAAALVVAAHPGPTRLDRWGFDAVAHSAGSALLIRITDLGDPAVLVGGSILAALVVVGRDRARALACVAGPLLAAVLVELVFKPLVGRHFEGVLSYPSGSVADIAALATAWAVAVPPRVRPAVVGVGAVAAVAMAVAVTGLRWHYPTDALGGAVLGVGTVLLVDGMLHHPRVGGRLRPVHRGGRSTQG
jgi:membrane-associated phospholipid phosphatase